jgi:type II secretory pathway pseudopilin PulG
MAGIAIMMILMSAAVPSWRYVMRNMREEELLFRGEQIAKAIERYQGKNGGAAPTNLEDLVKGKYLRKAWADPMTRDGKWRFLKPGDVAGPRFRGGMRNRDRERGGPGGPGGPGAGGPGSGGVGAGRETMTDRLNAGGLGGFVGVATRFEGDAFRIFNGRTKYEEWFFVAGGPRELGQRPKFGGQALPGSLPGIDRPGVRNDKQRPTKPQ